LRFFGRVDKQQNTKQNKKQITREKTERGLDTGKPDRTPTRDTGHLIYAFGCPIIDID
jgi:hypothetical protein